MARKKAKGAGAWDRFKHSAIKIREALGEGRPAGRFPRSLQDRSKYMPHQGAKEIARRRRQIVKDAIGYRPDRELVPGASLGRSGRGAARVSPPSRGSA